MLSLTVWFPQVSRKCHFLSQNSPTLYLLLSSHVSFPWTDDQSYLLQPWAKLETFICFFWQIYALLLSQSHLCAVFSLLVQPQLVGKWSLRQAPTPLNGCLLKIQEIDHLYNNHIKLGIIDLFVIHPITVSAIINQLNFYCFFYLNKRNYDFKYWLWQKQIHTLQWFHVSILFTTATF